MKRWIFTLALCLCVCLLVGELISRAEAADVIASGSCGDSVKWTLDSDGVLTIRGSGKMHNYSDYRYNSYNRVPWYSQRESIHSVVIEQAVTSIGDYAFYGCTSLTSITIPEGVTSIGDYAFVGCSSLTGIWVGEGNPNYSNDEKGVLYNKEKTRLIQCPERLSGTYAIPKGVTSIGGYAFYGCTSLTSITIPESVTSIGRWAFSGCSSLTSITIPDSVTSIDDGAFNDCVGLTSITIPDSVTSIGDDAFRGCTGLTSITIPDSVASIGSYAFAGCTGLGSVFFKGNLPTIASNAFNVVKAVALYPSGNTTYDSGKKDYGGTVYWSAYDGSKDTIASGICGDNILWQLDKYGVLTVKGGGVLSDLSGCALYKNMVSKIVFSEGITMTEIPIEGFKDYVHLKEFNVLPGVETIGECAFSGCKSLTSISIPDSVASIGSSAFSGCDAISAVHISSMEKWLALSFGGARANPLHPGAALYLNGELVTEAVFADGTTKIGCTFNGCTSLTSITIPDSVTSIGDDAFRGCTGLTSITIPDGVTSIKGSTFYGCSSLTSITIPESVTSIGKWAFYGCSSLTSIMIPDSVTSIGDGAFKDCVGLTSITIPDGVTSIGGETFRACTGLTSIAIPDGITSIGDNAFTNCTSLTSIAIPDGVTSIGDYAFYGCTKLTSVTLPSSITIIGHRAFARAKALKSVIFLGAKPVIGSDSFNAVSAEAYYPESLGSNVSWTQDGALEGYGGTLNLHPWWTLGNDPLCKHTLTDSVVPPSCTWGYTLHKCDCGYSYRTDFEPGSGHNMVTDAAVPATCMKTGLTEGSHCSRCDYKIAQKVTPKLGHDMVTDAAVPATCTETGLTEGSHCSRCDYKIAQEVTPKLGHDMITDAAVPATCTETGLTEGSHCSRCDYKIAQEVTPKLGHNMITDAAVPATCTKTGLTEGSHCSRCDYKIAQEATPKLGHDMVTDAAVPATCTKTGLTEGSHCSRCDYKIAQEVTPALGHDFIDHEAKAATCTEVGWEAYQTCSRCDYTTYKEIPVKGHAPAAPVRENEVAPTCTVGGSYDEVIYCSVCKKELSREAKKLDALGHDFIDHAAKAATCTEIGWEAYQTCNRCNYTTYKEISALGHDWGGPVYDWADDHSAITATRVCKRDPDHAETETGVVTSAVTKEATYDAEGEITYTATFANPAFEPQTAVVSLPRLERPTPTPAENPFTDIRESAYYYDPVLWAVANNVTNGTSDSTFSPDEGCTRAQVVTFLWRAAGKPDPASSESPFSDVKEGAYYYNAVLWAVETGITNGTSDTTFSPDETCTRAQIVTFLWRYEEQPAPAGTSNPFADVKPSAYFGSAVLWAVEKGITNGTSATTFDPEDTCTRAQVVTFLYRDIVKS